MRCFIFVLICVAVTFFSKNIAAVEVKDLYTARVKVDSQSRDDRNLATRKAFDLVLTKVSGLNQVLADSVIKQHRRNYASFVDNFRFVREREETALIVTFNEQKINDILVEADLPIWGSLRPQVVLWIVVENSLTRQLLAASEASALTDLVGAIANNRGLPVVMPLMDLEDNVKVQTADVWGRFLAPIHHASLRYNPEAIVVLRVSNNSLLSEEQVELKTSCELNCAAQYALDWSFMSTTTYDQQQQFSDGYFGESQEVLLKQALGDIADMLANQYAVKSNLNNEFLIDIANVDSLAKFADVTKFLKALSSVQSVKLVSASGKSRRFSLSLLGSEQALLDSLKLHTALKRYYDPLDPASKLGIPLFYWES